MNSILTLTDPLSGVEVVITVTLFPAELPRATRPVVLTLGIADQPPVILSGTYAELSTLLDLAWHRFQPATPAQDTPAPVQAGLFDLF